MWATGTTQMIARLTSSTLFTNTHLLSALTLDQSYSTESSQPTGKDFNMVHRMRELRTRSPYALFVKQNYADISSKHPDLKLIQVSKKMAEAWKSLDQEKKQSYIKQSQDQKQKYEEEKQRLSAADLQHVDADEKSRRIEHRVKKSLQQLPTKRPRSAYAHFLSTMDRGEADIGEFVRGAAQRWTHLSAQEKQKFEELHQQEKEKYTKALVAWAASNENLTKPKPRASSAKPAVEKAETPKKPRAKSATGQKAATKRSASKKTVKPKAKTTKKDSQSSSSSEDESKEKPKKSSS